MANTKISQLPTFTGNTTGSFIVLNDSDNTTTYKVTRETLFTGSLEGTASFARSSSYAVSSSYALSSSYVLSSSYAVSSSYALSASWAPGGQGSTAYTVVKPTTTYNAVATSGEVVILGNTAGGAFSVNLPTAVGNTAKYNIKKIAGSAALTVDANSTETIDGGLTAILNVVSASITLVSDNANWFII